MRRENAAELLFHSVGCCQGLLLASCFVQLYFAEVEGGMSMLKLVSLWRWGSVSVALPFFVNFREGWQQPDLRSCRQGRACFSGELLGLWDVEFT